jgi:hypothetical protein
MITQSVERMGEVSIRERKFHVEQKGTVSFVKAWSLNLLVFIRFLARGVRKVLTGITGLWQSSVHTY